ncbi:hypothetical protein PPERSA_03628 [Pseudocohnilembus persalinus]|uniref:LMBR1-like membrane protein n=1 Tax=Pseudocohnilembus persalinus TaxID=266149 RepID=A0A0V0QDW8_PSEPJ|nr:hypothetical protein PPERSA_03628 [Pseudocohnilembus persalinus]|eukprot:KRX00407.1 hypothetical protein PPERSA_03628 [Pseudocohnilembus persalinus]
MDWFLIFLIIVFSLLLIIVSIYILAIYCHPDDGGFGQSIWCKILVVLGLCMSWGQLLLLPLDIANSRGTGGGIDMELLWSIIYYTIFALLGFFIPQAIFYYESDEDKPLVSRILESILSEVVFAIFFGLTLILSYIFLNTGDYPLKVYSKDFDTLTNSTIFLNQTDFSTESQQSSTSEVEFTIPFKSYIMGFLAFLGYFFFVIFGGIGLAALPLDLIQQFFHRPKARTTSEARQIKARFTERVHQLIQLGETLQQQEKNLLQPGQGWWAKRRNKGNFQHNLKIYQQAVSQLDEEYQIFKLELNIVEANPIVASFLSTAFLVFLSLYLLWCVMKGNFKVGVRIPFLMTIHPMVPDETWMNSFLFNIFLIIICSVSVSHFVSQAFSQYARYSEMNWIFGVEIRYMSFFTYFFNYNVFPIAFLVISFLGFLFVLFTSFKKSEKQVEIDQRKQRLNKKTNPKYDIELQQMLLKNEIKNDNQEQEKTHRNTNGKEKKRHRIKEKVKNVKDKIK